jgi:DHA1 family bicyclomycin/chloramphenicol resistance-like MFS transporter
LSRSRDQQFILGAAFVGCLGTFGMHVLLPALPAIGARFAVNAARTQLLVSLALLAIALGNLTVAPLSDRFGRRPVTLAGLGLFVTGSLIGLVAPSLEWLVVARVVQAFGGGAAMAVVRATINDRFGPTRAATAIAYTAMVILVVPMLAPTLGGLALEFFGWRSPFALAALLGLAVGSFAWLRLEETHAPGGHRPRPARPVFGAYGTLVRSPAYVAHVLFGSFMLSGVYVFITGAPYVAIQVLGVRPAQYGLWFMVPAGASFLGFLAAARLSRRKGQRWMMAAGVVLATLGALILVALVAARAWAPLALFLPGALVTFANALSAPNSTTSAIALRPETAGAASGLLGFTQLVMSAVFAQGVALLENGTPWPLGGAILLACLGALLTQGWIRILAGQPLAAG